MKESMLIVTQGIDFHLYASLPVIVYFGVAFLLTLLMHSSSAMVVITLTAAHAGLIVLPQGMALIM